MEIGNGLKPNFIELLADLRNRGPGAYSWLYRLGGRGFDRLRNFPTGEQSPRFTSWRFSFGAFVRSSLCIVAPIFLMGEPFGEPSGSPHPVGRSVNPNGLALPFDRGSGDGFSQFATGLSTMLIPFGSIGLNAFARNLVSIVAVLSAFFGLSCVGLFASLPLSVLPFGGVAL